MSGQFQDVQYDQLLLVPGGKRVAVQVSHKNATAYEVDRALKLASEPTVDAVVLLAVEKSKAVQLQRGLNQQLAERAAVELYEGGGELGATDVLRRKLHVFDAVTMLSSTFNWKGFLDGLPQLQDERE